MEKASSIRSWFLAVRPKTLTASLIPILVASTLALQEHFSLWISLTAFLCSMFIQIGSNLINDVLDHKKGADTKERIGPKRATNEHWFASRQVLRAGFLCIIAAAIIGIPLVLKGGFAIAILLGLSLYFSYGYTGGPYPLSYLGISDLFIFFFYGFAAIVGLFYLQTGRVSAEAFLAGAQIGSLATLIGALNNLRDHVQDAKAHKKTIPVRFGVKAGKLEVILLILLPYLLGTFWLDVGYLMAAGLPLITCPLAIYLIAMISATVPSREYNKYFALSALLHLCFGLLLALGLYLQ